ncbi:flippase-like domain-containing protein [Haloarchaeobius sp. TZWWS8]|uniref:flippase-like domain-containing protein n=1 Tax=Haloarchaeobius sp. TZWWS8 TaxID=3446121 RepID=UPI003EB8184D
MELREFAVGLVVGTILVAVLAVGVGWEAVLGHLLAADRPTLVLVLLASLATVGSYAAANYVLVRTVPGAPGPGKFVVLYLAGVFAKQALPLGNAGGPALLAYVISRYSDAAVERTLLATTVAGIVSFGASALVAGVGFIAVAMTRPVPGWVLQLVALGTLGVAVAVAAVVGLALEPGALETAARRVAAAAHELLGPHSARLHEALAPAVVGERIDRFVETGESVARTPGTVALSFALSLVGWTFAAVTLSLSLVAVDLPPDLAATTVAVPLSGVALGVPLPGGLGGVEVTLAGLVAVLGGANAQAVGAAVVVFRVATFWFRLGLGGVAALLTLGSLGIGTAALAEVEVPVEEEVEEK